ncbi:MAG: hypothetical protein MUP02_10555 [Actinobacteria bacterium]|nr:hypothetical protein [Actinomycetota bacterium]
MNKYLKALLIIWELPQIFLAGIIIIFLRRKIIGREHYKNASIIYIKKFPAGISLGRFIILNDKYSGNELSIKHEYGHTVQSMRLGWLYLFVIGLPSIIRVLVWRIRRLKSLDYYKGYPENWANKLGFSKEEYLKVLDKLK